MIFRWLAGLLTLILMSACGTPEGEPENKEALRAVSIVPNITELIFAAGASDRLIGVTHYCDFPPEAKAIDKVGDMRINIEKLLSLAPDIVFSTDELAAKNNTDVEKMGIRVERLEAQTLEEMITCIEKIGQLLNTEAKSSLAASDMRQRLAALDASVSSEKTPTVLFISTLDPLWTPGPGSHVDHLIQRAGGKNVMTKKAWSSLPWEMVLKLNPEVIFVAKSDLGSLQNRAGWQQLQAVTNGRVHLVSESSFARLTPRSINGYEQLLELLHEQ